MDNLVINLEEKYVQYRFNYNGNTYVLICLQEEPTEEDEMYFAKEDVLEDGTKIIRDIESDEEYKEIRKECQKQMLEIGDEEDDKL